MSFDTLNQLLRHFNTTSYISECGLIQVRHYATSMYHYFKYQHDQFVAVPMTSITPLFQ